MPSYKVTYFNFRAKGESIRLMLTYMGEKFEDERFEWTDWPSKKSGSPFGKLPLLEIDGKQLHQTLAILRYLGKQAGLSGTNDWEALQIDMAAETIEDLVVVCAAYHNETNTDVKAKKKETLLNETAPFYLSKLDEQVKKNNGYIANGSLSWVDIYLFGLSTFLSTTLEIDIFEKYENLKVLRDHILSIPNIKAWVDKRPPSAF